MSRWTLHRIRRQLDVTWTAEDAERCERAVRLRSRTLGERLMALLGGALVALGWRAW